MIYQAEVISAICQLVDLVDLVDLVVAVTCIPTLWSLWMLHPVLRHPVLLMVYISIYHGIQWYVKICFDNFLMFLG